MRTITPSLFLSCFAQQRGHGGSTLSGDLAEPMRQFLGKHNGGALHAIMIAGNPPQAQPRGIGDYDARPCLCQRNNAYAGTASIAP
jgi:hypothetical protein